MPDPLTVLKDALKPIFILKQITGRTVVHSEIIALQKALDEFQPNKKNSFLKLRNAVGNALPFIEKWHVDFNSVRSALEAMNQDHGLDPIKWDVYLSRANTSPTFQFSADEGLLSWMEVHAEPNVVTTLERLVNLRETSGFSQKLNAHLKQDPDFLVDLIMESGENLTQIARTRLILFITDKQLAEAIIEHIPSFIQNDIEPNAQAAQLIKRLDELLSKYGRTLSSLASHSAEARAVFASSEHLRTLISPELQEASIRPPTSK